MCAPPSTVIFPDISSVVLKQFVSRPHTLEKNPSVLHAHTRQPIIAPLLA